MKCTIGNEPDCLSPKKKNHKKCISPDEDTVDKPKQDDKGKEAWKSLEKEKVLIEAKDVTFDALHLDSKVKEPESDGKEVLGKRRKSKRRKHDSKIDSAIEESRKEDGLHGNHEFENGMTGSEVEGAALAKKKERDSRKDDIYITSDEKETKLVANLNDPEIASQTAVLMSKKDKKWKKVVISTFHEDDSVCPLPNDSGEYAGTIERQHRKGASEVHEDEVEAGVAGSREGDDVPAKKKRKNIKKFDSNAPLDTKKVTVGILLGEHEVAKAKHVESEAKMDAKQDGKAVGDLASGQINKSCPEPEMTCKETTGLSQDNGTSKPRQKKQRQKDANGKMPTGALAFKLADVEKVDLRLKDESYWAKDGAEKGYGDKAQEVLGQVQERMRSSVGKEPDCPSPKKKKHKKCIPPAVATVDKPKQGDKGKEAWESLEKENVMTEAKDVAFDASHLDPKVKESESDGKEVLGKRQKNKRRKHGNIIVSAIQESRKEDGLHGNQEFKNGMIGSEVEGATLGKKKKKDSRKDDIYVVLDGKETNLWANLNDPEVASQTAGMMSKNDKKRKKGVISIFHEDDSVCPLPIDSGEYVGTIEGQHRKGALEVHEDGVEAGATGSKAGDAGPAKKKGKNIKRLDSHAPLDTKEVTVGTILGEHEVAKGERVEFEAKMDSKQDRKAAGDLASGQINKSCPEPEMTCKENTGFSQDNGTTEASQKKQQQKDANGKMPTGALAFKRVDVEKVDFCDPRLKDNSYWAKDGAVKGYGAKAQGILGQVRGRGFRHEKTKKKRGSYRGGVIDVQSHSIKFEDSDVE